MNEKENKMETMDATEAGDPGISPRSSSKLISSKAVNISKADLAAYYLSQTGMDLKSVLEGKIQGEVTDQLLKAIGKVVKPKVYGLLQLLVGVANICSAINTAMTALDLGRAIYDVYKRNGRQLRVVTRNYQWLSGSGNHVGYYSEIIYSTVM